MSGYSEEHLETKIKEAMAVDHVKAVDESDGCGAKFNITIVSKCDIKQCSANAVFGQYLITRMPVSSTSEFAGIPLLARHRKIHEVSYF